MSEQIVFMADLLEFAEVIDRAARDVEDASTQVIHQMGDEIAALAYAYAPKDTYELANSIGVTYTNREAKVTASASHAAFVEFGTWSHNVLAPQQGTYTIRPKKEGGVLRFVAQDGKVVYTRKVEHPGIRPQPYLGRAQAEVIDKYTTGIANVGVLLLVE